jgi:hypothetical protein
VTTRTRSLALAAALGLGLASPVQARHLDQVFTDLVGPVQAQFLGSIQGTASDQAVLTGVFDPTQAVSNLSSATFSQVQNLPIGSTVAGFTYQFDPNLAVFVRSTQDLGPLLAERAQTIGKGKLNVAFSYSRIEFDVFEGQSLSSLPVSLEGTQPALFASGGPNPGGVSGSMGTILSFSRTRPLGPGQAIPFNLSGGGGSGPGVVVVDQGGLPDGSYSVRPTYPAVFLDSSIDVDLYSLFANYGVTDWLDVGIVIPLLDVSLSGQVSTFGTVSQVAFPTPLAPPTVTPRVHASSTGIGDIIFRGKARLFETNWVDGAVRLDVSAPTGDEHDLQGRGNATVYGQGILSKTYGIVSPHLNFGFFIDTGTSFLNAFTYTAGLDVRVHPRLTLAADIVGSHDLREDGVGDDQVAVAAGVKVNPWRTLVLSGNALVRLNGAGLRSDVIPSVSLEYTFF